MCEDFIHAAVVQGGPDGVTASVRQKLLRAIESALRSYGCTMASHKGLPQLVDVDDVDEDVE